MGVTTTESVPGVSKIGFLNQIKPVGDLTKKTEIGNYDRESLSKAASADLSIDLKNPKFLQEKLNVEAGVIANFISIASDDKYASGKAYNTDEFRVSLRKDLGRFMETAEQIKDIYLKAFDDSKNDSGLKNTLYLDKLNEVFTEANDIITGSFHKQVESEIKSRHKQLDTAFEYFDRDELATDLAITERSYKEADLRDKNAINNFDGILITLI